MGSDRGRPRLACSKKFCFIHKQWELMLLLVARIT